ncbi:hypothetical protein cyc_04044 [Cyclospora cayetanensis]|uniref:Uncharacterized protein n=1 Tax=Cyclospora cayetanensis TaxID=88456 RepID=A0A1D3D5Y1_9EIME|nr:hypothetical protein cyc_04044 [Cyclospora cayetanensis]
MPVEGLVQVHICMRLLFVVSSHIGHTISPPPQEGSGCLLETQKKKDVKEDEKTAYTYGTTAWGIPFFQEMENGATFSDLPNELCSRESPPTESPAIEYVKASLLPTLHQAGSTTPYSGQNRHMHPSIY